jgi:hypothetical protein
MPLSAAALCDNLQGPALDLPVADERQASSWADSALNRKCMAARVLNLLLIDLVLLPAVPCYVGALLITLSLIAGSACLH